MLVDTGAHTTDSFRHLERAMDQVGLHVEQVRRLLITHAHPDHWGQAAPIVARAGCEMWMHPDHEAAVRHVSEPDADLRWRLEVGRQSGVPEAALVEYAEHARETPSPIAELIEPDRSLVAGVTVDTDLGSWQVHETPGHAPSHVCLYQPEHRLLISGDHLLGRISLFFDYGDAPDPIEQFLDSLTLVSGLRARLALSGHGKPFLDVPGHIESTRRRVNERLEAAIHALSGPPRTATDIAHAIHGEDSQRHPAWLLPQTLCYLEHLERHGRLRRHADGDLELWSVPG